MADFKEAIDNKSEYAEVQEILLGPIQTNLQSAFNLQVIPEFPLPLLMVIPALVGIIFAGRFKAFRAS